MPQGLGELGPGDPKLFPDCYFMGYRIAVSIVSAEIRVRAFGNFDLSFFRFLIILILFMAVNVVISQAGAMTGSGRGAREDNM